MEEQRFFPCFIETVMGYRSHRMCVFRQGVQQKRIVLIAFDVNENKAFILPLLAS